MLLPDNLFSNIPQLLPDELFEVIYQGNQFHIERIISRGHSTNPGQWYNQDWDEWVCLLKGQAMLLFEEKQFQVTMSPGDYLLIPAKKKHRVEWTTPDLDTIWLAIHLIPNKEQ